MGPTEGPSHAEYPDPLEAPIFVVDLRILEPSRYPKNILQRQREGVAVVKVARKYTGRPKSLNSVEIISLLDTGLTRHKTAKALDDLFHN